MMKDKKLNLKASWKEWKQSPDFFKNIFIFFIIILLFIFAIFIIIYRMIYKSPTYDSAVIQNVIPTLQKSSSILHMDPTARASYKEIAIQKKRLETLENHLTLLQSNATATHRLIVLEMLNEILVGSVPIKTLILYLQKNPDPWTAELLTTLSPIQESKTYTQLQDLLIPPPPLQSLSKWQRIKNKIKTFVSIRKVDAEGHYIYGTFGDIQKALHAHNIQQALDAFSKLSPEVQTQLSCWKQTAQNRLTLETAKQKIILQLSGN